MNNCNCGEITVKTLTNKIPPSLAFSFTFYLHIYSLSYIGSTRISGSTTLQAAVVTTTTTITVAVMVFTAEIPVLLLAAQPEELARINFSLSSYFLYYFSLIFLIML